MVDVFVDPVIIAMPHADAEKDVVDKYLYMLLLWLKEALSSPHTWYYSNSSTSLLSESDSKVLQAWQRKYKIDVNISLIMSWAGQFFNSESDLTLNLENLGYLLELEAGSISIHPTQFTDRWPEHLYDEMHMLLATVGGCKQMGNSLACALHIATLALAHKKKEIEISAKVSASIPDFVWDTDHIFTQTLPLLYTPDDLPPPAATDVINLWDKGEDGIRYAIDHWYAHDWQSSVQNSLAYSFSTSFFTTIEHNELHFDEVVLMRIVRAASAVIAGKAKDIKVYNLRQLRVSKTADSKQHTRESDNAKAWRLTLVKEGVGWRMHFWQIPTPEGSVIEFANILKKHDPEEIF